MLKSLKYISMCHISIPLSEDRVKTPLPLESNLPGLCYYKNSSLTNMVELISLNFILPIFKYGY